MTTSEEQREQLFEQLSSATTDEDRLVALTLLPKVLDESMAEETFVHIPFSFVHRLLRSDGDLRIVGLEIWNTFAQDIACMNRSKLLKRIPAVCDLLLPEALLDAHWSVLILQNLCSVLQFEKSLGHFQADQVRAIASADHELSLVWVETILSIHQDTPAMQKVNDMCLPPIFLATCGRMMLGGDYSMFPAVMTAIKLLSLDYFKRSWLDESLPTLKLACRKILSSRLTRENNEAMLILCSLLSNHTNHAFLSPDEGDEAGKRWEEMTLKKAQERAVLREDDVERVIARMESMQQTDKARNPDDHTKTRSTAEDPDELKHEQKYPKEPFIKSSLLTPAKLLILLSHLAGAEVRFLLDTSTPLLPDTERQALPLLYSLLQGVVKTMVENEASALNMGDKALTSIRSALCETYLAVAAFLAERWDLYESSKDEAMLNNLTTVYTIGAYSAWVDVETSTAPEEMERLVPLLVWVLSAPVLAGLTRGENVEMAMGLVHLVTSDAACLAVFVGGGGCEPLVEGLLRAREPRRQLQLVSVLINVVVGSKGEALEERWGVLGRLFLPLEAIVMVYTRVGREMGGERDAGTLGEEEEQLLLAHACVMYLFLYRSGRRLREQAGGGGKELPCLQGMMAFAVMRLRLGEEVQELWYLAMSAMRECVCDGVPLLAAAKCCEQMKELQSSLDDEDDVAVVQGVISALQIVS